MDYVKLLIEVLSQAIMEFFKNKNVVPKPEEKPKTKISHIPRLGENSAVVRVVQSALKTAGANITIDGDFGPKTKEALIVFQKANGLAGFGVIGEETLKLLNLEVDKSLLPPPPKEEPKKTGTPWFWKAKEESGKVESDAKFQEKLNPFWAKAGLPQFKGLVGSARAWCALFVLYALSTSGYSFTKGNASAKSWDNFGQAIQWKTNGFPQGAIVRINGNGDCASWSGNHVTFANGDCTAEDLTKSGASFSGYGGNQGNMAKVSTYPAKNICSVRWPNEAVLPAKITKSINCSNGKTDNNESTR